MLRHDVEGRLQHLIDRQVAKKRIHSVVVGIQSSDSRINAGAAAGHADQGRAVVMTVHTPYYLASITKMYTATVMMKLAASGTVELQAPAAKYLGEDLIEGLHVIDGIDYGHRITVSELLFQTSGLADYFEGKPKDGLSLVDDLKQGRDRALSIDDIVETVRSLEPSFAPGAKDGNRAQYSDTNYALLGAIIEAVTSTTVAETFQEMVFAPLALMNTYVFDHSKAQPQPAATFFKDNALEIPLAMSSFAPDGGIVSTVADSLRFLRALFSGELLADEQLDFMTSGWNRIFFPLQYGGGLMRYKLPRWMSPFAAPPELIGHSGSTGSFAFYDPERAIYLAGTVNQMDSPSRPFRLMTQMIGLLD